MLVVWVGGVMSRNVLAPANENTLPKRAAARKAEAAMHEPQLMSLEEYEAYSKKEKRSTLQRCSRVKCA